MASFLDSNRPDFGQMSMNSADINSAERNSGVAAISDVATTGIGAQAAAEAAEIGGAAAAAAAADSATGSMFGALGQIAGAGIGAIPTGTFGGGGTGKLLEDPTAKFKESVDVAIQLGIDAKKSDQNVRGAIVLPFGTGKKVKVAVFAQGEKADQAKSEGADIIGMEDLSLSDLIISE